MGCIQAYSPASTASLPLSRRQREQRRPGALFLAQTSTFYALNRIVLPYRLIHYLLRQFD